MKKILASIIMAVCAVPSIRAGTAPASRFRLRFGDGGQQGGGSSSLAAEDRRLLQESWRLQNSLGPDVWPGLREAAVPVILYNESFAFLSGSRVPPPPPWEAVEGGDISGMPVFRRVTESPQAFAVPVGDGWAASLGTLELINRKAPLKITPDFYVVLVLHEVFHAVQALRAPARFRRAVGLYAFEKNYPAKDSDFSAAWTSEGALLAAALKASDPAEILAKTRAFLDCRRARRGRVAFGASVADFEREMEWLEGLAQYAQVRFYELAAARRGEPDGAAYRPVHPLIAWDFVRLERQLGNQGGDLRFYLSGMAQARILDRLEPGWKSRFLEDGGSMEDRLAGCVEKKLRAFPARSRPES